jgi:acetyl esterase/lipase
MEIDHRVDPELRELLELTPPTELNHDNLSATRDMQAELTRQTNAQLPEIEGVSQEDRMVPGPAGDPDVRIRIYKPTEQTEPLPGFFWIHGGGYVLGDIDSNDYASKLWVKNVGCVIVSVDYRRAPEAPYPAPLEDCYAALEWMVTHADELGIDQSRIAIGGASAGGGLASGLALLVRDRAEMTVVAQLLMYPMINDKNVAPATDTLPDTHIWSRAKNLFGWTCYLGQEPGAEDIPIYAAAFRAEDLSGLPPALIVVGDLDLFLEENLDYAGRLIKAGVLTELHVYPGAYHGFNGFSPGAAVSRQCNADYLQALTRALQK